MLFRSLSGEEDKVNLREFLWKKKSKEECKSNLQFECGEELTRMFPQMIILEEFQIPRERLTLDFFLPQMKLAIECHGEQHFSYNSFFHRDRMAFKKSLQRDERKASWCELNAIRLLVVKNPGEIHGKFTNTE